MADTIILIDAQSLCTYVSPSVERVYGHRVVDILGKPALLLVHPADREPLRDVIGRSIAEGKPLLRAEHRFRHADGRFTWAESTLRVLYGPDGAYAGAVVSSRDSTDRRMAEEALRNALRVLVNSPAVVFRWRNAPGWNVELVTENVARYGYTAADLLSGAVSYASMVHPDDLEAVGREVQGHVASGHTAFHQEYRIRTSSGEVRWVDDHTVVERDESGAVIGFQGIVVDVTDRKRVEIALRLSEEKFAKFFYTSPDAVDIARLADGLYLEVNTGFTAITGYTADEAVGRTSIDLGIWVQAAERADLVREMSAQGGVPDREIRFRRKNGEIGFGLTSATLISIGGVPCLLSITKDITARRRLEREHEERRQFLERVLANAPDAVVTSDARHHILEWSEGARRLFGYTADEARGRTADELVAGSPGDLRREAEAWTRMISRGIGLPPTETIRFRKDGSPVHVITSVAPIEIDRQVVEVVAIYTDISDRVRAENEIRTLNAQLEERVRVRTRELEAANRELEAFAYSVSHDLRAPLRSIDGFSQALEEDCGGALAPAGREHLARIRAGAQRMGELIDGLLALSRVTRVEMKLEVMDVAETAREILAELARRDRERRVEVRLPERLPATCDHRLMRSALENLLENAWKFTVHRRPGIIEVGSEPHADGIAYFVRDNGAGFDMAYAGKLFIAFQRLHKVEEYPGIGLGLANVQRIVHRHGGRVWAEARPDQGATFWFTLPAPEETA
jgi:PAS domain S-box-containing protein